MRRELNPDFKCVHCHALVISDRRYSGVQHRNHCPYCLWSRHLDHARAGDRLSACKAQMRPVGLTEKRVHKKYGPQRGELMLIHQCQACGKISINRIAADDDAQALEEISSAGYDCQSASTASMVQTPSCPLCR
jgi:hypothetical protein